MKFYKVDYQSFRDSSGGFGWFTTKVDAEKARHDWEYREGESSIDEWANIKVVNIEPNKAGILNALNFHANHPDNG